MAGTEPSIPWSVDRTVVAFEIAVMQLMMKIRRLDPGLVLDQELFEARMRESRPQAPAVKMDKEYYGMRRDDEMHENRRDVD